MIVNKRIALATNFHIKEDLLCAGCEDRFNKGGEKWVLDNTYHGDDSFPICKALNGARPFLKTPQFLLFDARQTPRIDLNKLIYFAVSVFWRWGARRWRVPGGGHIEESLGPYQEKFCQFLLGQQAFPERAALIISISGNAKPHMAATYPNSGRVDGTWQHRFGIPGQSCPKQHLS